MDRQIYSHPTRRSILFYSILVDGTLRVTWLAVRRLCNSWRQPPHGDGRRTVRWLYHHSPGDPMRSTGQSSDDTIDCCPESANRRVSFPRETPRRRNVLRVVQRDTNSIRRLKKKEKKKQWAFQNKAEKLKSLLFQSVILVAVGVHVDRQWDGEVNSAGDAPCEFTVKTSPAPLRLIEVWLSQTQDSAGSDYIMLFDGCVQLSVTDAIICYLKQQE